MSVDILGTSWDQCRGMVQYNFTSTETRRLIRTDSPGWLPRLSHSSWTMIVWVCGCECVCVCLHEYMWCAYTYIPKTGENKSLQFSFVYWKTKLQVVLCSQFFHTLASEDSSMEYCNSTGMWDETTAPEHSIQGKELWWVTQAMVLPTFSPFSWSGDLVSISTFDKFLTEFRSCVKVEVAVLGSLS